MKKQWCISQITAEFIWRMEEVLDIYERNYDPETPVICFDERPAQLLGNVVMPIAMKSGKVQRQDYHYKRNGTCCVMMAVEPLAGKRIVEVRVLRCSFYAGCIEHFGREGERLTIKLG